jgi:CubicO group peptidase (beta-lactamase class C family)
MNQTSGSFLIAFLLCLSLSSTFAAAEDRPISGKKVPGFEPIDEVVLKHMDKIGCQAATIAISVDGRLHFSRGYGWSDEGKKTPVKPDALMRIASVSKPITAATVKSVFRSGQLSFDLKAFDLIAVKAPGGKVADPRINKITVAQLLEHQGGWDRDATFDPMFRTKQIEKELALTNPVTSVNVIEYMLTQPLQFNPGEKTVYSNFGYCVLGRVLEKVMKKPYFDCVQQTVCKPLGIKDIKLGDSALKKRDPREVWYPVAEDAFSLDIMDAHGGLIASTPALCQFLQAYWINGEPRSPGKRENWTFFGSLPGTTAMVRQREDGINVAVLFNGRREKDSKDDHENLKQAIDQAIDKISKGK